MFLRLSAMVDRGPGRCAGSMMTTTIRTTPGPTQRDGRMQGLDRWLTTAAALGAAVSGGVFFDFSFVVMPGLRDLPAADGIAGLQAFNDTAVTPPLMLLMYVTAALCVVLMVRAALRGRSASAAWLLGAAIAFLIAVVVITGAGNIPVSASVDELDPSAAGAAARWDDLYTQWLWWNHARALAAIGAAVGFAVALHPPGRRD